MKKIKITEKNNDKLQAVLDKANGKCKERLVDVSDLYRFVRKVEAHLSQLGVPKKLWAGTTYSHCEAITCNAYRYRATATKVVIERGASTWFLVLAVRTATGVGRGHRSEWLKAGEETMRWFHKNARCIVQNIN